MPNSEKISSVGFQMKIDVNAQNVLKILDDASARWWIDNGTFLGFVRDKSIIEWDNDFDLSILVETEREVQNAELQVTTAKNDLENAQIRLAKMKMDIPISGVIVDFPNYTPNSIIQQGAPLGKIMNYSKMYIDVNLPENTMNEIKIGQAVQLTNYSIPNDTLIGKITEISPAIDISTRTYLAKVRFSNPNLLIRPGMFVKNLIKVNQKDDIIIIPKEIIISDQLGKRVFVVEDNTAIERIIETGMENDDMIEVLSGLEVNERLVIKGFETLRNKSKVKVLK